MNGYVQRKCRSEQQLMNELSKLLASRDFASKKMGELMKELAFFYVAPGLPHIPHSVLKDLCALVGNLKDKKEDLRLARMALCFLARIADQFELLYQRGAARFYDPQQRTQGFELSVSVLAALLEVFEKSELNHASLPRQHTCLKLYALLCRIFSKTDALAQRTTPLLQKSPVWTVLSGDKKVIASVTGKKEFPSQLAAFAALFHMSANEQAELLELLFQGAFLPHHAVVSRHAAAAVLSLLEAPTSEHAKSVIRALEWYLVKFRPLSLRVGADPLTTIYLVRLCGQMSRLPAVDAETSDSAAYASKNSTATSSVSNLLDFSYEDIAHAQAAGGAPSPPPSPIARQRKQQQRLDGVHVTSSLATRLHDMLLDLLVAAAEQKPSTAAAATWIPNAVVLVAIEETLQGSNAASCFRSPRLGVRVRDRRECAGQGAARRHEQRRAAASRVPGRPVRGRSAGWRRAAAHGQCAAVLRPHRRARRRLCEPREPVRRVREPARTRVAAPATGSTGFGERRLGEAPGAAPGAAARPHSPGSARGDRRRAPPPRRDEPKPPRPRH